MHDPSHLTALRAAASLLVHTFAGFGDWKQKQTADGPRMVSPSGKRTLTLEAFQRLSGRTKKDPAPVKPQGAAPDPGAAPGAPRESAPAPEKMTPAPKETKGAGPISGPKTAQSKLTPAKGGPRPGEPERILTAKAKIARSSYEAAVRQNLPPAELEPLKRRAEAAEAELKAGPKPQGAPLSVASLPALPKQAPEPAPAPKPAAKGKPAAKPPLAVPEFDPKRKTADPYGVVRRQRTTVNGKSIVGQNSPNRAGEARAKLQAEQAAKPVPAVPPRADGAPDLPALKKSVDEGVVPGGRALNWGYETTAARAALQAAERQITDWARKFPRKVATLAREVTGEAPNSTEDGVKKLKAWVAETLDLLDPAHRAARGRTSNMSERQVFAELRGRMAGVRVLCLALAG